MRSMAQPSSRASLFLQPGLLLSPASSGASATTFAQRCQPCHPGPSPLAGSTASRATAPTHCQRSRAGCSYAWRPQLCVKCLLLHYRHLPCWISDLATQPADTGNTPQAALPAHTSIHTNTPTVLWDAVAPARSPHAHAMLCPSLPRLTGHGHCFQVHHSHQAYTDAANLPFPTFRAFTQLHSFPRLVARTKLTVLNLKLVRASVTMQN